MAKAVFIPVEGKRQHIELSDDSQKRLKQLQGYVGGYIDGVSLPDGHYIFVDDEGLLKGKELNRAATILLRDRKGLQDVWLFGDAVLTGPETSEGGQLDQTMLS